MYLVRRRFNPTNEAFNRYFEGEFEKPKFKSCNAPAANIIENNDAFEVVLAVPGMDKKNFKMNIEEDILTVSAEMDTKNEENINFTRKEFSYGNFNRSFYVPDSVDAEKIKASYNNGLLSIVLPKKPEKVKVTKEIKVV